MTLPREARIRLANTLREGLYHPGVIAASHTLPCPAPLWRRYQIVADTRLRELHSIILAFPGWRASWTELNTWIQQCTSCFNAMVGAYRTIAPFEWSMSQTTVDVAEAYYTTLLDLAGALEHGDSPTEPISPARVDVLEPSNDATASLESIFNMEDSPLDASGEFDAAMVLRAHAYHYDELLTAILPHFKSAGLPPMPDILAMVSALGRILTAPDPIFACASAQVFMISLQQRPHSASVMRFLEHLQTRELAERQLGALRRSARQSANTRDDPELAAIALGDYYRRLVEGPVRQLAWGLLSVHRDVWQPPPMLSNLAVALVASDLGILQSLATNAINVSIRNGAAHEDLAWDGFVERFVSSGGSEYSVAEVRDAADHAESFVLGAQAAVDLFRASRIVPAEPTIRGHDESRMPTVERIRGYFATNRIIPIRINANQPAARIELSSLSERDINPCFQALIQTHQLLPRATSIALFVTSPSFSATFSLRDLEVSRELLKKAHSRFAAMPLSAFLPMNLVARMESERPPRAVRNAAWIAVDDAISGIEEAALVTGHASPDLLVERLRFVESALSATSLIAPPMANTPLKTAIRLVADARRAAEGSPFFTVRDALDRLYTIWDSQTPPERLPGIMRVNEPDTVRVTAASRVRKRWLAL